MARQKQTSRPAARRAAQKASPAQKRVAHKAVAKSASRKAGKAKVRGVPAAKRRMPRQRIAISHYRDEDFKADGLRSYAHYRDLGVAAASHGLAQAHVIRLPTATRGFSVCSVTSGGQFSRTSTSDVPLPVAVYPAIALYRHAPRANRRGLRASVSTARPLGRQICPPCVCPLSIRSNPACAAWRYASGVCDSSTDTACAESHPPPDGNSPTGRSAHCRCQRERWPPRRAGSLSIHSATRGSPSSPCPAPCAACRDCPGRHTACPSGAAAPRRDRRAPGRTARTCTRAVIAGQYQRSYSSPDIAAISTSA